MNRKYTREDYLEKVAAIRRLIPDCGLTTDIFIGYHNESEEDFPTNAFINARGRLRFSLYV